MGAARLKSHKNEREIFLSCPRLSYVSPKCVNQPQPDPAVPRAYLKYIHYDPDSQFVSMGYMPICDEANEGYQQLLLQLVAQEDGFVQFFVANETLRDVYFDDITGMVRRPKIIQEGHYNPFGLPLAGLTTLGNPEYAYFFTWKELYEDEALQWYDYGARMYDVQIGRWTTHDPLYQMHTPYGYCGNNAVNFTDPDGRWFGWDDAIAAGVGFVVGYVGHGLTHNEWGKDAFIAGGKGAVMSWLTYNLGGTNAAFDAAGGFSGKGLGVLAKFAGNYVANTALNAVMPRTTIPITNKLSFTTSFGVGLGGGSLTGGMNFGFNYTDDNLSVSAGMGVGGNGTSNDHIGYGGSIRYKNWGLGYNRTKYSGDNSQVVGGVSLYFGKHVSFRLENDFFGDQHDRWRSNAAELSVGNFVIGTNLRNNEVQEGTSDIKYDWKSRLWGKNSNPNGAWDEGQTYSSPAWIGFKAKGQVYRFGYSDPVFQDGTQNFIHKYFGPGRTNYFNGYDDFQYGPYGYQGYYNPYSLW